MACECKSPYSENCGIELVESPQEYERVRPTIEFEETKELPKAKVNMNSVEILQGSITKDMDIIKARRTQRQLNTKVNMEFVEYIQGSIIKDLEKYWPGENNRNPSALNSQPLKLTTTT